MYGDESKLVLLTIKLPQKMKEDVIAKAIEERTSMSDIVRRALFIYLYLIEDYEKMKRKKEWVVKRVRLG